MKETAIVPDRERKDVSKDTESLENSADRSPIFNFQLSIFNLILFLVVAGIGLTADLASKHWAFSSLGMPREYRYHEQPELDGVYWIWSDVFGFQTSLNEGALFGMGQGRSGAFAALSFVALAGILVWLVTIAGKSRFLVLVLALLVAGILGNLYDRLGLFGLAWPDYYPRAGEPIYAVRDWILVMIGPYHWPNFNIADAMLVCGVILLMLHAIFTPEPEHPSKHASEHASEHVSEHEA